jgi:23S rRNA (cytosine1962-C5)-methyltransferase
LLDERHETAVRLFNGFLEGCPQLVVELFGATAVLYNYADPPAELDGVLTAVPPLLREQFPWLQAILVKTRHGSEEEKRGVLLWGGPLTSKIREHGRALRPGPDAEPGRQLLPGHAPRAPLGAGQPGGDKRC